MTTKTLELGLQEGFSGDYLTASESSALIAALTQQREVYLGRLTRHDPGNGPELMERANGLRVILGNSYFATHGNFPFAPVGSIPVEAVGLAHIVASEWVNEAASRIKEAKRYLRRKIYAQYRKRHYSQYSDCNNELQESQLVQNAILILSHSIAARTTQPAQANPRPSSD